MSSTGHQGAEITIHGGFRCRLDVDIASKTVSFNFVLHEIPLKSMRDRDYRIAVYADKAGTKLLDWSNTFRIVKYKLNVMSSLGIYQPPTPLMTHLYEVGKEPLSFGIELIPANNSKPLTSKVRALLDVNLIDANDKQRNDLIKTHFFSSSWWLAKSWGEAVGSDSSYVSLPALISCGLCDPTNMPVAVQVSVESIESDELSPSDIGSCRTSFFVVDSKINQVDPNAGAFASTLDTEATEKSGRVVSSLPSTEVIMNDPKAYVKIWAESAKNALEEVARCRDVSEFDKAGLFHALSRYQDCFCNDY